MDSFRIFFLGHSGFLMELSDCVLIFDAYKDPAHVTEKFLNGEKPVYVFVSHEHGDHFNPKIYRWVDQVAGYFVHRDCAPHQALPQVHLMEPGDECSTEKFSVHMYGSTDAGGSFFLRHGDRTIFHAGDLNWWHWAGENDEENEDARAMYFQELERMRGLSADVAFFPVDARQEVAREWGVREFLAQVPVKELLVAMHAFGSRWCPSYAFRWRWGSVPLWIPEKEGDDLVK